MRDVYPLLYAENGVQGCVTRIGCADCVGLGEDCWFTLKSAGYDTKAMMFDIPFLRVKFRVCFVQTCIPLLLVASFSFPILYILAFQIGLYLFLLHVMFLAIFYHISPYLRVPREPERWKVI